MNKTFKVIFSKARNALMVVNEATGSVQAKGTKTVIATAIATALMASGTALAADRIVVEADATETIESEANFSELTSSEFGGAISNAGTLTDISRSGGSAIYVDPTAKLEVNYVEVYCSNFAIGAQSSEVIINDGIFVSVSNNQIRDESGASTFTYCVNVGDGSIINGGTTIGIQGGTSINNGSVIINEGYTSTVDADLAKTLYAEKLEEINETHPYTADELARITDSISFYALYIAGETELNPVVTINGGYYYSCYRSAALIGNSNDGGVGSSATCTINGGTFETDGTLAAISIDSSNPDYGLGFVRIYGGYYTDSQAMRDNLDKVLTADYTYKAIEADGLLSVIPA